MPCVKLTCCSLTLAESRPRRKPPDDVLHSDTPMTFRPARAMAVRGIILALAVVNGATREHLLFPLLARRVQRG